jgi:hypothetical protein
MSERADLFTDGRGEVLHALGMRGPHGVGKVRGEHGIPKGTPAADMHVGAAQRLLSNSLIPTRIYPHCNQSIRGRAATPNTSRARDRAGLLPR